MKKERKEYFFIVLFHYGTILLIFFLWEASYSALQKKSRCWTCQQSHVAVLLRFRSVSLNLVKCKLIWNSHPCCWWRKPLTKLGNKIYSFYIFTLPSLPHPHEKRSRLLHSIHCENYATVTCRAIPASRMVQGWIKNRVWWPSNQTYLSSR